MKLTDTQRQILKRAAKTAEGKLGWFPDNVKGGARKKVIDSLVNRALITPSGSDWVVAAEGYDALGVPRPVPSNNGDAKVAPATTKPRTRGNSKQAQVIAMLKRPEGATIQQICTTTGWQQHTVRGTFAGAFKKKLGLNITSTKDDGAERVYRIGA
jgi:hypothetical protein